MDVNQLLWCALTSRCSAVFSGEEDLLCKAEAVLRVSSSSSQCCCGCSLRTGALIVGWVYLILSTIRTLSSVGTVVVKGKSNLELRSQRRQNVWRNLVVLMRSMIVWTPVALLKLLKIVIYK